MRRRRALAIAAASVAWLIFAACVFAASPTPAPEVGDPRSSGQGPGLVGDPGIAILVVIAIGLGSVVATLVYVRLTADRNA